MAVENLITEHLDIWTSSVKTKSTAGRGRSNKLELVGVKKLRELILELAVRGKLVPQDPNDEPASELLKKIEAEKARLIKEGKIKKQKPLPLISDEEKPFKLPDGWEWVILQDITSKITDGDHKTPPRITSGFKLLSAKNVRDGYVDMDICDFIAEESYIKSRERCLPEEGDLMIVSVGGTIGRSSVVPKDSAFALVRSVALIKPLKISSFYFKYAMDSQLLQESIHARKRGGAQPCLYLSEIGKFPFSLPPLAEQHRIVAKVDELMSLCDQLEAQTENRIQAHQLLVETLLATLTNAKDADELNENWQTISQHFDVLFTTQASIDQLKQTILQLAVMGKLVKQDPSDEPASKLLERIATEKQQLIKDGKIKKQKPLPPITDEEKPFDLPEGWGFERFGNLTSRLGSGSTPRGGQSAYVDKGVIFLRSQNVWNDGLKLDDTAYITDETNEKMYNTQVFPGDVLLNITGASLGRSTIFPEHLNIANVSQHVTIIRLIEQSMGLFVHLGILSPLVQRLVWGRQVGMAIEGLSKKVLELFEFPIPPLAEQHRIVAKVDELMTLCDSLKAHLNQAQTTQLHLTDAIVERAL
ncbi:type-1 restriction enzyme EcoEI specificity protein [Paraglaciecola mesophila KMM 241]|uniref:Type-1 restriction enzyme EcoEI specificity protein n=1 Tax=Paraglaciecola mesophila KMM 241 TaxID=1128912 RepID=K6Z3D1_9ALTE|nr:restriction endonuclease subunit S [Paraglaciecola mesophila]GAC23508.1 type-1 restriction enzyme EcoEI specificity protein [Paraglaciecola mesophila KMM 241]